MSVQTKLAPKANGHRVQSGNRRICVVMVGLPARGKSLIAQKAERYLKWLGIDAKVFNVGDTRRKLAASPPASFFDATNPEGEQLRRAAAEATVEQMLTWFSTDGGQVAIFDATNSTKARRQWIQDILDKNDIAALFVESKCDDEELIMKNVLEVKTRSPDYDGQDPELAVNDFMERIKKYEKVYQTIDEDENDKTYLKIMNVGKQVIINRIQDYLQSRVIYYLMNLHIRPRSILLSRHGESEFNLTGQIGGDAQLSARGELYARKLPEMVRAAVGDDRPLTVWTSTLKRTIATARFLPKHYNQLQWKALDELDAGVCDGLTYEQIEAKYEQDFKARDADKYNYRYRGGESYKDVVTRLEPIIMELERSENILIITHQAVVRCIYSYFMAKAQDESPWMKVPLHTLIQLTPRAYEIKERKMKAAIPAVSTWRSKGSTAKHDEPEESGDEDYPTDPSQIKVHITTEYHSTQDDEDTKPRKQSAHKTSGHKLSDEKKPEEKPAEEKPTEEKPAEEKPIEEKTAEVKSSEGNPTTESQPTNEDSSAHDEATSPQVTSSEAKE